MLQSIQFTNKIIAEFNYLIWQIMIKILIIRKVFFKPD